MSAEKPKPCPFCGGEPRVRAGVIWCPNVGCLVFSRATDETDRKAIRRWNTRRGENR